MSGTDRELYGEVTKMIDKSSETREKILNLVEKYYYEKWPPKKLDISKDKVRYAGRVFDQNEIINLVDSSLDFWLTAGRYAEEFEMSFAEYFDVSDAILVNSGSSVSIFV